VLAAWGQQIVSGAIKTKEKEAIGGGQAGAEKGEGTKSATVRDKSLGGRGPKKKFERSKKKNGVGEKKGRKEMHLGVSK